VGSDDGIKIWLNQELVHSIDAERLVKADEDRIEVNLKEGWNAVLVKVSQHSGDWGACLRLSGPGGAAKLKGIRVALVNE